MTESPAALAEQIRRLRWYHTLELADGVVTEGMFDHRPAVRHYLLPASLTGKRCLDVGTMDGFWAFEMERRGASEVVAADLADPEELDWPPQWRARIETTMDETKAERFRLAHQMLGSRVQRVERSVYDLGADLGEFDLIFCGDLLVHLKDPVTAVQRMRSLCRGSTIICNPLDRLPRWSRRPLAEFDGIDEFRWWMLSEASLRRMMLACGFAHVEVGRRFKLAARGGGKWKGWRAILRGFVVD